MIDGGWLDRAGPLSAQRIEQSRKLKSYDGVLGVPLVAALEQSQLVAADDSAFDVERRKLIVERSKNGRKIDDVR